MAAFRRADQLAVDADGNGPVKTHRYIAAARDAGRGACVCLTPLQRQTLTAYYFQEQTIPQIAAERGVNKSTVCRTLHRAENKLRRYLRY